MIPGYERILYILISGVWTPIGCLTSNGMEESVEFLPSTVRDSGGWRTIRPTNQSYSIDFAGIQYNTDGDLTKISYDRLKELKRNRTLIQWKLEALDSLLIDLGYGYITDIGEQAPTGELLSFEGTIQGYGAPSTSNDGELPPNDPPTAPILDSDLKPQGSVEYIELTWSGATDDFGISGYEIRLNSTDGTTDLIFDVGLVNMYEYYSWAWGYFYQFNVRAYDESGQRSPWSNAKSNNFIASGGSPDAVLFNDSAGTVYALNELGAIEFNEA